MWASILALSFVCIYVRTYFRCRTCLRVPCTYVYVYVCMYVHVRKCDVRMYTHMRTWVHVSCMRWASHESYTRLHTHIRMLLHIVLLWHDAIATRASAMSPHVRTCKLGAGIPERVNLLSALASKRKRFNSLLLVLR